MDEHDLNQKYLTVRPAIFGALCDLAVNGLRNLPTGVLLKSKGKRWKGTCGELLHALRLISYDLGSYGKMPESPRGLGSRLRRDAPAIRKAWGVDIQFTMIGGRTMVVMEPLPQVGGIGVS